MTKAETGCRVCGSRRSRFLCRNLNEHSATRWLGSFRCRDCGSVFIGNRVAADELTNAYAGIDYDVYYRETAQASMPKFAAAACDIARLAPPTAAILDIGGGDGAFLRALRERGFTRLSLHEIPGAEAAAVPDVASSIYRDDDYGSLPKAAFDVVTLMDVMEHVADPASTLAAAHRSLRQGGVLYVHTPAVTALDRLMHAIQRLPAVGRVGAAWQRSRTSIFHLQIYAPEALRQLAERAGFAVMRLETVNELSWPVARYVQVYLVDKAGLPRALSSAASMLLGPLLRSRLNANKAILVARAVERT